MNKIISSPHTAVIDCKLEMHKLNDSGECSGQVVGADYLNKNDIKNNFIISVTGYNLDDCIKKLKKRLEEFNNDSN